MWRAGEGQTFLCTALVPSPGPRQQDWTPTPQTPLQDFRGARARAGRPGQTWARKLRPHSASHTPWRLATLSPAHPAPRRASLTCGALRVTHRSRPGCKPRPAAAVLRLPQREPLLPEPRRRPRRRFPCPLRSRRRSRPAASGRAAPAPAGNGAAEREDADGPAAGMKEDGRAGRGVGAGAALPQPSARVHDEQEDEDAVVNRISLFLSTFTLAVSAGAVLLLPFSIISNEILLAFPQNYYIQWLNGSLIHG
ncbi:hypothetical protein NN561_010472 [Cricetulus griseus]